MRKYAPNIENTQPVKINKIINAYTSRVIFEVWMNVINEFLINNVIQILPGYDILVKQ